MTKSNIYTFTGDKGTTSLVGGQRVSKTDIRLEAYGTVDELNSFVGLLSACSEVPDADREFLTKIQNRLFNVGAYLATDNSDTPEATPMGIGEANVSAIEGEIDRIDALLPRHFRFILPGGCESASRAHVCRTVARRCERRVLELAQKAPVHSVILKYLNRLSDYFFVLARYLCVMSHKEEIFWSKD